MTHQVFICHSSKDKAVADAACASLEAQDIGCWIAPRNITAGVEYGAAIIGALSSSQVVVLIFSQSSNDSPQVRREIERAVSKNKIIVPFRIEEVLPSQAMEYALSNTHWLDAGTGPMEDRLTELCAAVAELIGVQPAGQTMTEQPDPAGKRESAASSPAKPALTPKSKPRRAFYTVAAALLVLTIAVAAFLYHRSSSRPLPVGTQWEQLTFFTDSAVYPTLSSDGRTLAFIRGGNSFIGLGEIYVKLLPSGEAVQLTHDARPKLSPSFSPDNSRIAYSVTDPWDTWEVPVLGGEPHLLLPNSSSLSWIEGGKRLLFSEIKVGLHLAVVTTDEARGDSRDVYDPVGNRSMAHHSYLSPDGRWVLVVEMNTQEQVVQCRVVPFQGPTVIKLVGPPNSSCLAGAWSPDGRWIYLTAKTDDFRLWRQRFPDGEPEQLTFGPASLEGIAMAPDGKSLITSVGTADHTVWLHDKDGDHQISSEGDGLWPSFSSDGRSLYFLRANGQTPGEELWVKDLSSDKVDRVLPGYPIQSVSLNAKNYSVSQNGKQVAFVMRDKSGRSGLWIAATSHRSSPRRISSEASEDSPLFLPNGDLLFRAIEGGTNFLYGMKADGTGRHKIIPDRILEFTAVSPDGRWAVAATADSNEEHPASLKAFAMDGSASVMLCTLHCMLDWDTAGKFVYVSFPDFHEGSFVVPVMQDTGLPRVPPAGIASIHDLANVKTIVPLPWNVGSALNPSVYAYTRENTRRNLYRIQLP
jgi:Tol biopolymer transport system component